MSSDIEVIEYLPKILVMPERCLSGNYGTSSWVGLESILTDLLNRFKVGRNQAVEFGVEHGYSAVALSNFFHIVVGVDPFGQWTATEPRELMSERFRRNCQPFQNIRLEEQPWQKFTDEYSGPWDLVHVDAEHGYYDTFGIGEWACKNSPVVLFHDTISFPETVMPAVKDLARKYNRKFYNYPYYHGLGILVTPEHDLEK